MSEHKNTKSPEVSTPHPEEEPAHHPRRTARTDDETPGTNNVLHCDGQNGTFPGPLMSVKMQKDELIRYLQRKHQECLLHVDGPDQAYFFWLMMEHFCRKSRRIFMAEIAMLLFRGYSSQRRKLRRIRNQEDWCLPLSKLLCSNTPEDEHREEIIKMGEDFASRGWIFAAHICYVVAQVDLGARRTFKLIGCDGFPEDKSAMREALERTEVYEYVLSLTSGFGQPDFQEFKYLHACKLVRNGFPAEALDYFECIATTILNFPECFSSVFIPGIVMLCEELLEELKEEQPPEWLQNLTAFQRLTLSEQLSTTEEFSSRYIIRKMLGGINFSTIYSGECKADGKQVSIKYLAKNPNIKFITMHGKTRRMPLEVALLQMVSRPPRCENVLELLEWFETSTSFILVFERPIPSVYLWHFCRCVGCRMPEPVAQKVMRQVVRAVLHCYDRGVFHQDIRPRNILINPDTMEVKLMNFSYGELLKDDLYTSYAGSPPFSPPEWIVNRLYFAVPATVWSLGAVLFQLVTGTLPFKSSAEVVCAHVPSVPGLSEECRHLISICLQREPKDRPTLKELWSHDWLQKEMQEPLAIVC